MSPNSLGQVFFAATIVEHAQRDSEQAVGARAVVVERLLEEEYLSLEGNQG
jgi:hypothetical protein